MEDQLVTIRGLMPASQLEKRFHVKDGEKQVEIATEYYAGEEMVRRDLHVHLKHGLSSQIDSGNFGG